MDLTTDSLKCRRHEGNSGCNVQLLQHQGRVQYLTLSVRLVQNGIYDIKSYV